MIRLQTAVAKGPSLKELRKQIDDARRRQDMEAIMRLRYVYLLQVIDTIIHDEVMLSFGDGAERLRSMHPLRSLSAETWGNRVGFFLNRVLYFHARQMAENLQADWQMALSPAQLREATGLAYDKQGVMLPPVSEVRSTDGSSLKNLLVSWSGLLVPTGDTYWHTQHGLLGLSFLSDEDTIHEAINYTDLSVARPWWAERDNLVTAGAILALLRHELIKILGRLNHAAMEQIPAYAGYRLRSRLLTNTDPDHAAKDGWTFYKDKPNWANRIIPPYRKNCVCYMSPLLEQPTSPAMTALFTVPVHGRLQFVMRDPQAFATHFDALPQKTQKLLVGEERWFAALSQGQGPVAFQSLWHPTGKIMPTRRLLGESRQGTITRRDDVLTIIYEQSTKQQAAQQRLGLTTTTDDDNYYRAAISTALTDE